MQDIVHWDYGSWPDGLPKKGGANALSGVGSLDTATTCLSKTSRTKNFIIEKEEPMGQPRITAELLNHSGYLVGYEVIDEAKPAAVRRVFMENPPPCRVCGQPCTACACGPLVVQQMLPPPPAPVPVPA